MRKQLWLCVALLLSATAVVAGTVTIGKPFSGAPNASDSNVAAIRTDISLEPATANGTIDTVRVYWSQAGCTNAIKIKFFHRVGNALTLFAERGPTTAQVSDATLLISPVTVQQGDVIGVARVAACGNPATLFGTASSGYVAYSGDVTGTLDTAAGAFNSAPLFLYGTGTSTSSVVGVLPVTGSVAGSFGSQFKTQFQVVNPSASADVNGTIVFHPAAVAGGTNDATTPLIEGPGRAASFADIVASPLGRTGLGTIDIVLNEGSAAPVITARIFNDAGTSGTSGLSEDLISLTDRRVLSAGIVGYLVLPPNVTTARYNVGVRSLFSGASVTYVIKRAGGTVKGTVTKTYVPTYFEQVGVGALFPGVTIEGDDYIQATVTSGNAIIYGSTTDNTTNDPAIQFATTYVP